MEQRKNLIGAGQHKEYADGEEGLHFPRMECPPLEHPDVEPFEIHPKYADKDFVILADVVKFIPGITADMVDWWWANLEKGYFLWAPGEHYGFEWIIPPCDGGYMTVEASYEFDPANPMAVTRRSIADEYPFAQCYEHVIMSTFETHPGEMILIHTWQDQDDGILWRDLSLMEGRWYKEVGNVFAHLPDFPSHMDYESRRLNQFLPQLYDMWKDHPDPWQNMHFDLRVRQREDGTWERISPNLPPSVDDVQN
ncbi:MAG: hypothetical protein LIO56_07635 [Lachnospiraceae bacterium]|nr:hypothetical protein [Lachnospiraceae bacterium]